MSIDGGLDVDSAELTATQRHLSDVIEVFRKSSESTHAAAALVGHSGLERKVREFSDAWDVRREEIIDDLHGLHEAVGTVRTSFDELDSELTSGANDMTECAP